jgi:hypothetical protein
MTEKLRKYFRYREVSKKEPVPVAARCMSWDCIHSPAGIAGSNPAGAWASASYECCVLSGRGLCGGLITLPEESYRVWCM